MSVSTVLLIGIVCVASVSAPQFQPSVDAQNSYYENNGAAYNNFQGPPNNNPEFYSQGQQQQQLIEPQQDVGELHEKVTTSCYIPLAIVCWADCARQKEFGIPNCCKRVGLTRFNCDCVPVRAGVHGESMTVVEKLKQMVVCGIASVGGFVTGENLNSENLQ